MLDDLDLTGIHDQRARALIIGLLNLIKNLSEDVVAQDIVIGTDNVLTTSMNAPRN
jgi:hypothetical protein